MKNTIIWVLAIFASIAILLGTGLGIYFSHNKHLADGITGRDGTNLRYKQNAALFAVYNSTQLTAIDQKLALVNLVTNDNTTAYGKTSACVEFLANDDGKNCSADYKQKECFIFQLPNDLYLTESSRNNLESLKNKYPVLFVKFKYLRPIKNDAKIINELIISDDFENNSSYPNATLVDSSRIICDIISVLDQNFGLLSNYSSKTEGREAEKFDPFIQSISNYYNFQEKLQAQKQNIDWKTFTHEKSIKIKRLLIRIGASLDILRKTAAKIYLFNSRNDNESPFVRQCERQELYSLILMDAIGTRDLFANASGIAAKRKKRALSTARIRNNERLGGDPQTENFVFDTYKTSVKGFKKPLSNGSNKRKY